MRVRPGFRRLAIGAFALLLPIAAHQVWDVIEIRRLVTQIDIIRQQGEPVTIADAPAGVERLTTDQDMHDAAPYYLAGAMLTLSTNTSPVVAPLRQWLAEATPDRTLLPTIVGPIRRLVIHADDALRMTDRAAALPFHGFPPGSQDNYRAAGLANLSRLIGARTLSLSVEGHGDAAVASALSALHVRRALSEVGWPGGIEETAGILSLSRPSTAALRQLQTALEQQNRPERALEQMLRARARHVETLWRQYYGSHPTMPTLYTWPRRTIEDAVLRPIITHRLVGDLVRWQELIEVTRRAWPQRFSDVQAIIDEARQGPDGVRERRGWPLAGFMQAASNVVPLIIDRCSATALAIERYRRDRQGTMPRALGELVPEYLAAVPADPYAGQPLQFRSNGDSYTVYSIGANRKDDGGDLTSRSQFARPGSSIRGEDIGVRVLIQP